ncbi:MAG: bacteriohemerythrin [Treponema sp.]|jgi:hemerythrin|nr:bacteriohemerythrin [Treponema sp.]
MGNNDIVEWNNRFLIGIPLIDKQHKNLVDMTNKLYMGCLKGNEEAGSHFLRAIHEAVDYTRYHFSTEEQLMRRIGYPELAAHRRQHEDFIREILREVNTFKDGKKFVPNLFVRYLRDWVLTHIAVSDRRYAAYIHALKKQGALGFVETVRPG